MMVQHTRPPWVWQEARHTGVHETAQPRTLVSLTEDQFSHDDGRNLGHKHVLVQMASVRSSHADAIYDINLEIHATPEDEALIAAAPYLLRSLRKMTEMARFAPLEGHGYDGGDIDEAEAAIREAETV